MKFEFRPEGNKKRRYYVTTEYLLKTTSNKRSYLFQLMTSTDTKIEQMIVMLNINNKRQI